VIVESDARAFGIWVDGTEDLRARKPVTRGEAVAFFKVKREALKALKVKEKGGGK